MEPVEYNGTGVRDGRAAVRSRRQAKGKVNRTMALYDYYCEANDRTVEVRHGMSESLETWGDLCEAAGIEPGDTPDDAPIRRLMGIPVPVTGGSKPSNGGAAPCGPSCGCAFDT